MERSFKEEVKSLRLGAGETFHGEGILAVTKALLQSGVSYISGYPGAPVSHLVDVLTDAEDILDDLGVHFEPAANEAAAAAMSLHRSNIQSVAQRRGNPSSAQMWPPTPFQICRRQVSPAAR
jgi:TPP-dependent indolepyruvate ferredoxin oxidoreductase alpha subunit